ncbi:unnamed protein product [Heterotrigona itama]|uniref:Uncharacterized protein n=1 Tax=Heterotrigona itama TaxID=395501 RepID=A0A6V7GSX7_9HYME|nr:unnamed protein product [Heterotrigona itama]
MAAERTAECHHCGAYRDTVQHTLKECAAFEEQRHVLRTSIGEDLSPAAMVKSLLAVDRKRMAVTHYCEEVMTATENAERARELCNPTRMGRRRARERSGRSSGLRRAPAENGDLTISRRG